MREGGAPQRPAERPDITAGWRAAAGAGQPLGGPAGGRVAGQLAGARRRGGAGPGRRGRGARRLGYADGTRTAAPYAGRPGCTGSSTGAVARAAAGAGDPRAAEDRPAVERRCGRCSRGGAGRAAVPDRGPGGTRSLRVLIRPAYREDGGCGWCRRWPRTSQSWSCGSRRPAGTRAPRPSAGSPGATGARPDRG